MADEAVDKDRMPLLAHLVELRSRLIKCAIGFVLAFILCYYFSKEIFDFLAAPLHTAFVRHFGKPTEGLMIYTQLYEKFFTEIKVAFWAAMFLSFPWVATQMWMFIAPGLYKHEKSAFLPFLAATPVLFVAGAALAYYVIFPFAWEFFLSFEQAADKDALQIKLMPKVSEYLSLVMTLIFAFGVSFEMPVLLTLLARVGIVSSAGLIKKWRHAFAVIFIISAILTPPDVISQLGLAIPLCILYFISIIAAKMVEKKRAEKQSEIDKEVEEAVRRADS